MCSSTFEQTEILLKLKLREVRALEKIAALLEEELHGDVESIGPMGPGPLG